MTPPASHWIMQESAGDFWTFAILSVVAAASGFIGALYFFLRKRTIEDTPTSKISSAAQGYVELSGRGQLMEGSVISAPLTGTSCTWYSYTIEAKSRHWSAIEKGSSENLFLLVDASGEAVIDPENASVTPSVTDVWYGYSRHPKRRSSGIKRKNGLFSPITSLFGIGHYRYIEKRMYPGDPLYALGLFNTVGGAGEAYDINADVANLLREWKANSQELLARFDENKDGKIDMEEWQKVRAAALKQVQSQHSEQKTAAPVHLLGKTCDLRRPYLLSALPEYNLAKRYRWYSTALLATFFIAGACATWMISIRLSM